MKINFNLWSLAVSGGTRTVFELSNRLIERGHDVTLTALTKGGSDKWYDKIRAEKNYLSTSLLRRAIQKVVPSINPKTDYEWWNLLYKAIPDCDVNVATYHLTAFPTKWSGKGKQFYLIQHYEPWFFKEKEKTQQAIAETSYKIGLNHLCVSNWLRLRLGGTYVGNGVNASIFRQIRDIKKPEKPYRIMIVHRNIDWKGGHLVRKAVQLLQKDGLDCKLVTPNGVLSDNDLVRLYNSCHVFVFASKYEGYGLPPLEAMKCGIPVVTSDCCGVNEYVEHLKNAYVFHTYEPKEIALNIKRTIFEKGLTKSIVEEGLKTASENNFERMVDRFEQAIET